MGEATQGQLKPQYRAWFESLHDPQERYGLDEVVYKAEDGALLQVVHDAAALSSTLVGKIRC